MPRSKDRSRSEREKLRELSFMGKLEYIWSYYNYFIVGAVVGIVIIISIFTTCTGKQETGLSIEWSASYIDDGDFEALKTSLNERLFPGDDGITVQGSIGYLGSSDPAYAMQYESKIAALLTVGGIDIFFLDAEILGEYSLIGYLLPLENMLAEMEAASPAIYERISGNLQTSLYCNADDTYTEQIVGIRITDSPMFNDLTHDFLEDVYFCVAITSANHESVKQALTMFFE